MDVRDIKSVCIVGGGFMGIQIGLQCAVHGFAVSMVDVSEGILKQAERNHEQELIDHAAHWQITPEEKEKILNRIAYTTDLKTGAAPADLIIETIPEKLELKKALFRNLDQICVEDAILATNSSSLRISLIAKEVKRQDHVINFHCYPPVWQRPMVEIMQGPGTSDETVERVRQFAFSVGLVPLMILRESTGFLFNRVWRAIKKECLHLVDDGVASHEDVDRAWMIFTGMNAGPFGLMDLIGLDVIRDIENVYYSESGDQSDAPPKLLENLVTRNELGMKSGRGFYTYPNPAYENPAWLKGNLKLKT